MPGLSYVPSVRTIRRAWMVAGAVFLLVFSGLVVAAIATTLELNQTNARLDESESVRRHLTEQMQRRGVRLTFVDTAPNGLDPVTFRCRVSAQIDSYTCTPERDEP